MKFIIFLCMTCLAFICPNSYGKKRAHPLSFIQTVVTEIIPVKKFKILVPQKCNETLGSWRQSELGEKLNKLKKNKKCWAPDGSKLSLNLDASFWYPLEGQIQAVIFDSGNPIIVQVNDEFSFLGKDGKLQFRKNEKSNTFSPKTLLRVTSNYIHPCFSQSINGSPNDPYDRVFWNIDCLDSISKTASSSQFLGFNLVHNQSLRNLDRILAKYWSERSLSKDDAVKLLKEKGLTQFEYLLKKFDSHNSRGLQKTCFKGKPIEEFSANIHTLGGDFEVRGELHACPYIELRFE